MMVVTAGLASGGDLHLELAKTRAACQRSAFLHGYLHGYEEAFHLGNLDFQFGRRAREVNQIKEARKARGYQLEFGAKHFFDLGFREGFKVGYADGVSGRPLRALAEAEQVVASETATATEVPSNLFDEGFSTGYKVGQQQGLADARQDLEYRVAVSDCEALRGSYPGGWQQQVCDGFMGGYQMGYADGYVNQKTPPLVQTAREKSGGK